MNPFLRRAAAALLALASSGCMSLPDVPDTTSAERLVQSRSTAARQVSEDVLQGAVAEALTARLLAAPLDADAAVQIALVQSPRIRELEAELGIVQADLLDATRPANPLLGWLHLAPDGAGGSKTTWSLAQSVTDLLFSAYRRRVGHADALQARQQIAHAILQLEADVRTAFHLHAGARTAARVRAASARSASLAAELAERFHVAGNITQLQRQREEAAASEATLAARQRASEADGARARLLTLLGLPIGDPRPRFTDSLALPPDGGLDPEALAALAFTRRLDLAALVTQLDRSRQQSRHVARWGWLGETELRAERETERDGRVLTGGGVSVPLPVFDAGQGARRRASATVDRVAAQVDGLRTGIRNDIAAQVIALESARGAIDEYRTRLLPLRESIVALSQREQNFMLIGAFELLAARREEIETYERYIDAVRDYWIARTALARTVGGDLPTQDPVPEPLVLPDLGDAP